MNWRGRRDRPAIQGHPAGMAEAVGEGAALDEAAQLQELIEPHATTAPTPRAYSRAGIARGT